MQINSHSRTKASLQKNIMFLQQNSNIAKMHCTILDLCFIFSVRRSCLLIYKASRTCRRDSDYGHGRRTRWPFRRRTSPLSATALSRLPLHEFGTLCRRTFGHPVLCQLSSVGSRLSFSRKASLTEMREFSLHF